MAPQVRIEIANAEITTFAADAIILKYSRSFHGADEAVAAALRNAGLALAQVNPAAGDCVFVPGKGSGAQHVVFVGTPRLVSLNYREVGEIVRIGMSELAKRTPDVRHIALTLHGPGIGLDESQAFLSELKALYAALADGRAPSGLEKVTFVEKHPGRARRMRELLEVAPQPAMKSPGDRPPPSDDPDATPHIFVAMPFSKEMEDVFYYGIQKPIHAAGFLCERIDHAKFTGDIVDRILKQISTAELVIAECTGANPNVYLEIGYAWGCNRNTLLLARTVDELRFDIRGHRAILYERILDLETALTAELAPLAKARKKAG
ncbi:MAG: hypothetical protein JST54_18770 [Deltaproteobacteria bacterium]|nr:hypothetical protein [Deltaproteobacteria bacterium]